MKKFLGMVLVLLFHSFLSLASPSQTPTVIIIGAGMSGISAAKTLQDAGIRDILILEATDRIGGRVMKTQFSGYAVEMGANWLFGGGPVHNPVLEMAKKVKLKTSLNDYDNLTSNTYKQDGGLYPKKLVEAVDKVAVARDDFCAEFSTLLTKKVKNDVDISILAGQRLFKQEPKTPLEMVIDYYHNDYEDGEPPKVTSLKHTYPRNEFVDHGEDPYFVADPRGFEIVVQYLAKQFLSSLKSDLSLALLLLDMAGNLMHALQYDSYGGGAAGLKHVEVPVPSAKKDEVLLKLEATSLNPYDFKIQKGVARPFLPRSFPYIPALDIAGEVVAVGPGVEDFKTGDKVVAVLSASSGGGLAEFAVAKKSLSVARPPEVSAAEAAGLPIAGLTAYEALTQCAGVKLDGSGIQKNILITAASGGVGHYAVQLAKLGNTYVTATCGARNIEFVKDLGADEVLDYKTPEGAALKSPSGKKYDAVIHGAPGIPWSTFEPNLSENGKVIHLSPGPSTMISSAVKKLTFSKKQLMPLLITPKGEDLKCLVNLVKEGKLKTVIDSKHPLSKAEDACAKVIDGHATGKIIVEP